MSSPKLSCHCAREVLAAELRDPVGRHGPRHDVLRGRVALRLAVDRRGGGEDDPHAAVCRGLEEALRGQQVPVEIGLEDVPEAPNARLPGQVEDAVEAVDFDRVAREVTPDDRLPARVLLLQGDVVVVREAVEADDVVPLGAEGLGQVGADEAGGAGDEIAHQAVSGRSSPPSSTRQTSE